MDGGIRQVSYPFPEPPRPGGAVELADGVLWLRIPLPMRPDHINIYALDDGDGWTVIDTGFGSKAKSSMSSSMISGAPTVSVHASST